LTGATAKDYETGVTDTLGLDLDAGQALRPADYHRLARSVGALAEPRLHLHVLGSFSAQFLEPLLMVEAYRLGLLLELTTAPFGQFEQELHGDSPLRRPDNRAALILLRPEDVDPDLFRATGAAAVDERLGHLEDRVINLARALRAQSQTTIFVANAGPRTAESGAPSALNTALHAYNARLERRLGEIPDAHLFDWADAVASYGAARWEDPRLWYLARVPCSQEAAIFLSRRIARRMASVLLPRAKCVVIDLDDTIWGGAVGDEGVEGIKLGDAYPGSVFKDFQFRLKELTRQGILLAIASKNDEATVRDAFARHPEMVLRWEDFACHRISWNPKELAIPEIARELNIGVDSLVFLDDNPVECAAVKRALPAVQVHCLGRDPLAFASILSGIAALDRPVLTGEDRERTQMYREARQRREHEQQFQSREEFLASLGMKAEVALCDEVTLPRVVQLIEKTNQFNLTTRRHRFEAVRAMLADGGARVATLRLADIYGDLGLVCVGIVRRSADDPTEWRIDTFLMSCRVMGRGVEDAFLAFLAEQVRAAGGQRLCGEYLASAKNGVVAEFYPGRGFGAHPSGAAGQFQLDLSKGVISWPPQIQRLP
jgi:FkbH-like protein